MTFDKPLPIGLYNPNADELNQAKPSDTRKAVLTLRDLNKLKKLRAFRQLESLRRRDKLETMYGSNDETM